MNIRKIIRLILKIPATPGVVMFAIIWQFTFLVVQVFEYVYEASDFNRKITQSILDDNKKFVKKWFTTV
jgi:hypothetical protein